MNLFACHGLPIGLFCLLFQVHFVQVKSEIQVKPFYDSEGVLQTVDLTTEDSELITKNNWEEMKTHFHGNFDLFTHDSTSTGLIQRWLQLMLQWIPVESATLQQEFGFPDLFKPNSRFMLSKSNLRFCQPRFHCLIFLSFSSKSCAKF